MRIITGKLKGRRFDIPKGLDVRPTTDRTKESIFNKIEVYKYIEGSVILDLFGGSGNLGFEAISRGAKSVTYVELDPKNVQHIEKTAEGFGIENQIRTTVADVRQYLDGMSIPYDFIFCDPPYNYEWMEEMITTLLEDNWLKEDGWFILEHDKYHNYKDHPHCFFSKAYGRTTVSIFEKHPVDSK
ncbi:MAG: 16S rRNA (guanine(966)-N(2))-methyltransferase RsmD [Balneolaceae bacterium]|nr:16S rRNA (guanine(966)-N(2))-methyltransferase RsmD [Balneolaceae bacterium]MBO6545200.1 16S rRNA (guanine(966)-N(2))-methyltransferase RsmD [Balneolaceae bacterium]MBO6646596.1 16S rRNA (guanine(966)-N(2))-methyltransferase RsmD [Balneolaceae bacterium]